MNERLAALLLAGLSTALIVAETATAALRGFEPGIILFWLSLYAGAAGLLLSLKTLSGSGRDRIESVSERRARARKGDALGGLLDGYEVDEEFLGSGQRTRKPASSASGTPDDESLRAAISSHAGMAGGLGKLRELIESMDDTSFLAMTRKFGAGGVSRERVLSVVAELAGAESGAAERPALEISLDRETFDDYIRRCMTDRDTCVDDDEAVGDGFTIGLDAEDLASRPGAPPTEFSHKPDAVKAKIPNQRGAM